MSDRKRCQIFSTAVSRDQQNVKQIKAAADLTSVVYLIGFYITQKGDNVIFLLLSHALSLLLLFISINMKVTVL